ncbi:helix-turn-helix transcriptional regulator [Arthrobacter cryoconiti]|nr:helix-turn-helix transcriptional regulator [Arthrobacter cryoconiti]
MNWIKYVTRHAKGETQSAIAKNIGVSGATISRWQSFAPRPENVTAFARAYNRPVLEAFVAAGFLTPKEAKEHPTGRPDLSTLTSDELVGEVRRRMETAGPENKPATAQHKKDSSDRYDLAADDHSDEPDWHDQLPNEP